MRSVNSVNAPRSRLSSAFFSSFIADSFNLSISSQQLAADPLNDDDTVLQRHYVIVVVNA